ncbi:hypothetical protein DFH09DRAFT_1272000, partial [Mycena vulgaris]
MHCHTRAVNLKHLPEHEINAIPVELRCIQIESKHAHGIEPRERWTDEGGNRVLGRNSILLEIAGDDYKNNLPASAVTVETRQRQSHTRISHISMVLYVGITSKRTSFEASCSMAASLTSGVHDRLVGYIFRCASGLARVGMCKKVSDTELKVDGGWIHGTVWSGTSCQLELPRAHTKSISPDVRSTWTPPQTLVSATGPGIPYRGSDLLQILQGLVAAYVRLSGTIATGRGGCLVPHPILSSPILVKMLRLLTAFLVAVLAVEAAGASTNPCSSGALVYSRTEKCECRRHNGAMGTFRSGCSARPS